MQDTVRRKLETLGRVSDFFFRAHPFPEPSNGTLVVRFDQLLARARTLAVQEQGGRLETAAATKQRREVRRTLREIARYLSRLGELAARQHPELRGRFHAPQYNANNAAFLAHAWDLVNLARANRELLAGFGLDGAQLDEIAGLINRLEATTEKANAGRRSHVGARAELFTVTTELIEVLGVLDILNRARFRDQAELLAGWNSARNVTYPTRGKTEPPAQGTPTPPKDPDLGKAA